MENKVKMLRYMDDPIGVKCWGKAVPEIVRFESRNPLHAYED